MEKTMDIIAFVSGYSKCTTSSAKESYLNRTIKVNNYVSYMTKIDEATKIVNASSYQAVVDENGNYKSKNIRISSPIRFALTMMEIIDLYTNISVDITKFLEEFDALNSLGVIEKIIAKIPESEITEFNTVVSMVYDDFIINENEIHRFIESQVSRLANVLNFITKASEPALEKIAEKVSSIDDSDIEKLSNKLIKVIDKVIK